MHNSSWRMGGKKRVGGVRVPVAIVDDDVMRSPPVVGRE